MRAKYHPEQLEKWQMLMEAVGMLDELKEAQDVMDNDGIRVGVLFRVRNDGAVRCERADEPA